MGIPSGGTDISPYWVSGHTSSAGTATRARSSSSVYGRRLPERLAGEDGGRFERRPGEGRRHPRRHHWQGSPRGNLPGEPSGAYPQPGKTWRGRRLLRPRAGRTVGYRQVLGATSQPEDRILSYPFRVFGEQQTALRVRRPHVSEGLAEREDRAGLLGSATRRRAAHGAGRLHTGCQGTHDPRRGTDSERALVPGPLSARRAPQDVFGLPRRKTDNLALFPHDG